MNLCVRLFTIGLFLAFACVVLNGCGSSKPATVIKGKLVVNGAPFSPPLPEIASKMPKPPPTVSNPPDMTQMYRPRLTINSTNHSSGTVIASDGTFELRGDEGKGVPPGEYSVSITGAPIPAIDPFGGKLSGASPFKVSVPQGAGATITLEPFEVGPYIVDAPAAGGAGS